MSFSTKPNRVKKVVCHIGVALPVTPKHTATVKNTVDEDASGVTMYPTDSGVVITVPNDPISIIVPWGNVKQAYLYVQDLGSEGAKNAPKAAAGSKA